MDQVPILAILYDLALHVSGEVRLAPLLGRVLQRFLYHTGFPAGVVLLVASSEEHMEANSEELVAVQLAQVIGDRNVNDVGQTFFLPRVLVEGTTQLMAEDGMLATLPLRQGHYKYVLRLIIPEIGAILLLSHEERALGLPVAEMFKPVLANLGKAIEVCRLNESQMQLLRETNERLEQEKAEQKALNMRLHEAHTQLLQSEKLASIGQLAAGVAHEINNPIGYVKSNLHSLSNYVDDLLGLVDAGSRGADELRRMQVELDYPFLREDITKLICESSEGVSRVQEIVRDLKDFAHVDQQEWQSADLHRCLDSTLNLARNEIKYKAEVVRHYGDLPLVECNPQQLNQVFMNIFVNAAQAIPEHGVITVSTRVQEDWVIIEIADTGVGIPAENLTRIFEPFFTTKAIGKGTGLGLSIAYGIINNHGGRIDVDSKVGSGTTFRLWLPSNRAQNAHGDAAKEISS